MTGCGKDKITSKTCELNEEGLNMTATMTATNDVVEKIDMTIIPENSYIGIDSFEELDDDQKAVFKDTMLSSLGVTGEEDGVEVDVKFDKKMTITLNLDFKKADKDVLKTLGFDVENASDEEMSLERAVKDLEDDGATCK